MPSNSNNSASQATNPPTLPSEVFLDTSIHVALHRSRAHRRTVVDTLAEFAWKGTGSYAKVEYGNVILSRVCYYLDKLRKLRSFEALRDHVTNVLQPKFRTHHGHQQWFSNLLQKLVDPTDDQEATARAEALLENLWEVGTAAVDGLVDEVRDGIGCIFADQSDSRRWQKPNRRCRASKAGCRLPRFFADNQETFVRIARAIRRLPEDRVTDQLQGFANAIDRACRNPEVLRDHRVCRSFGDAILAVQSLGYTSFFTMNVAESDILCRELRQLLVYLPQKAGQPVEYRDFRPSYPSGMATGAAPQCRVPDASRYKGPVRRP